MIKDSHAAVFLLRVLFALETNNNINALPMNKPVIIITGDIRLAFRPPLLNINILSISKGNPLISAIKSMVIIRIADSVPIMASRRNAVCVGLYR